LGGLGRYWAAQWNLARAEGKRFRGCRTIFLYVDGFVESGLFQRFEAYIKALVNIKAGELPIGGDDIPP